MDHNDYYLFGIIDSLQNQNEKEISDEDLKYFLEDEMEKNDTVRNAIINIGLRTVSQKYKKWGGIDAESGN